MANNKINQNFMQRHKMLLEYSIRDGQAPSNDSYYGGDKRVELKEEDPVADTAQGYQKKGDAGAPAPEAGAAPQEPQSPADAMIPDMGAVENPDGATPPTGDEIDMEGDPKNSLNSGDKPEGESDPNESREDVISQLIQLHSDKLKSLEDFANQMADRAQGYDTVVNTIPEVQAKLGQLEAQVEELTPDTPLQAMANVPNDLGGTTPEDWWNSYWADKNQNKQLSSSPYYPQQKGDQKQAAQTTGAAAPKGEEGATYYMKASDLPDLSQDEAKNSFTPKTY